MAVYTRNLDGTTPWTNTDNPNSCKITYDAGETAANVLAAVDAFLTAHGWTAIGTSGAPATVRSYKALNAGGNPAGTGTNYKYIILDVNTAGYILLKVYESVTGVAGTNLSYNSDNTAASQRLDVTNGGTLWLAACETHVLMYSQIGAGNGSSTNNGSSGCFEIKRVNPALTIASGFPFWAALTGLVYSASAAGFTMPRTLFNSTASTVQNGLFMNFCNFGVMTAASSGVSINMSAGPTNLAGTTDPLTGKYKISDIQYAQATSPTTGAGLIGVGPIYNIKFCNSGSPLDEVSVAVDAEGFLDPQGTPDTWILFPVGAYFSWAVPK